MGQLHLLRYLPVRTIEHQHTDMQLEPAPTPMSFRSTQVALDIEKFDLRWYPMELDLAQIMSITVSTDQTLEARGGPRQTKNEREMHINSERWDQ